MFESDVILNRSQTYRGECSRPKGFESDVILNRSQTIDFCAIMIPEFESDVILNRSQTRGDGTPIPPDV